MIKIIVLFLFLSSYMNLPGQVPITPNLPEGYFIPPIKHQIGLSGNFCELRNNHFHAGLDFRSSNGVAGNDIVAVASGFVSRIKIERGNYGNALYITHPCGLKSLYAHLKNFDPKIAAFIEQTQMEAESFEINICPDSTLFRIEQGDVIGQMGNTGHSFGPHLHFELRDVQSDIAINPMHYGFKIEDHRPPVLENISFDILDDRMNPIEQWPVSLTSANGAWVAQNGEISLPGWQIGLVVGAYDKQDNRSFNNGIYKIELYVDDSLVYQFVATHCDFEKTNEMNAHVDYPRRIEKKQWAHRCYIVPNNTLALYDRSLGNGRIKLYKNRSRNVRVVLSDYHGNSTDFQVDVTRKDEVVERISPPYHAAFKFDKSNLYSTPYLSLFSPQNALFHDANLIFSPAIDSIGRLSSIMIGDKTIALKSNLELTVDLNLINRDLAEKAVFIYTDHRSKGPFSAGSSLDSNGLKVSVPYLGLYELHYDTIPPIIRSLSKGGNVSSGEILQYKVSDNFEVIGEGRELRITQNLDDRWIIGKIDLKTNTLTIPVSKDWTKGPHVLKIEAVDDKGNRTQYVDKITVL